jgi:hypothetical protein
MRPITGRDYGKARRCREDLRRVSARNIKIAHTKKERGFQLVEIPFPFCTAKQPPLYSFSLGNLYRIAQRSHRRPFFSPYGETRVFKAFILEGCLSFLIADTSICRTLSLVRESRFPTSSRV